MELQNFNKIENEFLKRKEPIIRTLIDIFLKADKNLKTVRDYLFDNIKENYEKKQINLEKSCGQGCIYFDKDKNKKEIYIVIDKFEQWHIFEAVDFMKENKKIFSIWFKFDMKRGYHTTLIIWNHNKIEQKSLFNKLQDIEKEESFKKFNKENFLDKDDYYFLIAFGCDLDNFQKSISNIKFINLFD